MKKIIYFLIVPLIFILLNCPTPTNPSDAADVDILPVIDFNSGQKAYAKSIAVTEKENFAYYMYAPILTGWKANSIGVKTNSSYLEGFLGTDVTVSVSRDVEKGTIIFTGVLSDNNGNFIASYNPANKTFDYEQNIFIDYMGGFGYLRSEFSNVQLDHNNYFHTGYMSYFLDWNTGDTHNGTVSGYCQGQEAMRMQVDLSFWGATACCKSYNLRM